MKTKFALGLAAFIALATVSTTANAGVQSSKIESKALFELLFSMHGKNEGGVVASNFVRGDFTVMRLTMGKGTNVMSCSEEVSQTGDSVFYECEVVKDVTLLEEND